MANAINTDIEIPEVFEVTEPYDSIFSEHISDSEQSILNISRRLSTIHEFLTTESATSTPTMGDVSIATREPLPSSDESLINSTGSLSLIHI